MTKSVYIQALLAGLLMLAGCASPWDRVQRLNVKLNRTSRDGLEISLEPRDSSGHLIRLNGNLTVKLWVYDNPRASGFTEGAFRQEWLDITLDDSSYGNESAEVNLPFKGFYPDVSAVGALDVTLIEDSHSISGNVDGLDVGSESFR